MVLFYGVTTVGFPSCPNVENLFVEYCKPDYTPLLTIFLSAFFYGALAIILHGIAKGMDIYLEHHIKTSWFRYIIVSYITLLILQLWVEVFPWTLSVPYRYS